VNINNTTPEEQRKEQHNNIVGLGWKNFGVSFFVIVIAIVMYAILFH